MSSLPTPDEIAASARWLLQALDPASGTARVVDMDREAYRSASFLDDRMLQRPVKAHAMPWTEIAAAIPPDARDDARWIFHIGHVGSTLLARMLGELDGVLSVREPRLLRDVALLTPEQRAELIPTVRKLLSRTFTPSEAALVKATSFVSEIAADLAGIQGRPLFLFVSPRAYVATILAGPNSRVELEHYSQSRRERLASRQIALDEEGRSLAHRAAAAWACEMIALEAAADAIDDPLWLDFDAFLGNPAAELGRIAGHFGFEAPADRLRAIADGPLMRRYSKALEHDYSPELRRELLDQALAAHGPDIDDALAMLGRARDKAPLLARALERTES